MQQPTLVWNKNLLLSQGGRLTALAFFKARRPVESPRTTQSNVELRKRLLVSDRHFSSRLHYVGLSGLRRSVISIPGPSTGKGTVAPAGPEPQDGVSTHIPTNGIPKH